MSQRARAELARAVHPPDDAAVGELVGDAFDERRRRRARRRAGRPRAPRAPGRRRSTTGPQNGWSGNVAIRIAEVDAVGIERRAERAAGIAGRRRHEDALEAGLGEDARVGDAVQRHAAAEAEIGQTGFAVQRARDLDERVLEDALHAGGAVGEAPALGGLEVDRLVADCAAARTGR